MSLNKKVILLTGGTGSFGKKFVEVVFSRFYPQKIIIYSRDELKQYEMQQLWPSDTYPIRYFIGDVRDLPRLRRAMEGVDIVIHAAAFKQVPAAEYNPFEAIKTNVLGSQNVIEAAMDAGVKKVMAISSDKAVAPINLYGATKLTADKLFIAANNFRGTKDIKFSVVRYGNVMGSRGSVLPYFLKRKQSGVLPITDVRMTRFNITLDEAVNFVIQHLSDMQGGEIFVPKLPSYRVVDLAKAIAPEAELKIVGIRPGEKLHEDLITPNEALSTLEYDRHFVILFSVHHRDKYLKNNGRTAKLCKFGFNYNSGTNKHFLSVEELRTIIQKITRDLVKIQSDHVQISNR